MWLIFRKEEYEMQTIKKLFYSLIIWILSLKIFYSVEKLYKPMTTISASQRQLEDSWESYTSLIHNDLIWNFGFKAIIIVNIIICLLIFKNDIKLLLNKKIK